MGLFDTLSLKLHEWGVLKHNATVRAVEANTVEESPDSLQHRFPFGTFIEPLAEAGGGGGSSPIFRVRILRVDGQLAVQIERGLIGGVEPVIGTQRISEKVNGRLPSLAVRDEDFDAEGQCRLYLRVDLDPGFRIAKVAPVASAVKLGDGPWFGHELLGILVRAGRGTPRYVRFSFSNKKHIAVLRRNASGLARNLFIMDA